MDGDKPVLTKLYRRRIEAEHGWHYCRAVACVLAAATCDLPQLIHFEGTICVAHDRVVAIHDQDQRKGLRKGQNRIHTCLAICAQYVT